MKRNLVTMSNSWRIVAILLFTLSAVGAQRNGDLVQVRLQQRLASGTRNVVANLYATAEGGTPIASETHSVQVVDHGAVTIPVRIPGSGAGEVWLAVQVPPGNESGRIPLASSAMGRDIRVNVVPLSAIIADGLIESTIDGFKFPDGSIQTTAASGGVSNVNGVTGAVLIAGGGTNSVQTAGNTITITGAHGNQAGGSLHSTATTGTAGFMSATDKAKLDGTVVYVRTIVVSPAGSNAASGTALVTALNGISGNSASSPFLLHIEPGVYDIGANALTMKTFVDIEGSGEDTTFIVSSRGGTSLLASSAAVTGAINAELRQVTITNTAPGSQTGIGFFANTAGVRITNVTINSTSGTTTSIGLFATSSATVTVSRATITATGVAGTSAAHGVSLSTGVVASIANSSITAKGVGGSGANNGVNVSSSSASLTLDGCTIISTGTGGQNNGVSVATGNVTVTNSTVQADTNGTRTGIVTSGSASSIVNVFHSRVLALAAGSNASELSFFRGASSILRVATSQLDSASVGTPKCVHVYDADMDDLNNVCPAPVL